MLFTTNTSVVTRLTIQSAILIAARLVSIAEFDKLTANKQLQRYISLLDGRIIMHEVPDCPHGEVIGHITFSIGGQLGVGNPGAIMVYECDNGILLSSNLLTSLGVYHSATYRRNDQILPFIYLTDFSQPRRLSG
jgi:hypothetical protein